MRFQKAIAEGASTSQVTAISVLASIYLQAVIAASMEEVELFLAPLTARSKVREVLRGLVATRQVHTISLGHAPHFYVAGTLPEFSVPSSIYGGSYSSSSMPASAQFLRSYEREFDAHEPSAPVSHAAPSFCSSPDAQAGGNRAPIAAEAEAKPSGVRPHFSRKPAHARNRKPASSSSSGRGARGTARSNGARTNGKFASRLSSALGARRSEKREWKRKWQRPQQAEWLSRERRQRLAQGQAGRGTGPAQRAREQRQAGGKVLGEARVETCVKAHSGGREKTRAPTRARAASRP